MNSAVKLAREVLEMHDRILELEYENEHLREFKQKYDDLLSDSIVHSKRMVAGVFTLGMQLAETGHFDRKDQQ